MKKTLRLVATFGLTLTYGTVAWAGNEKLATELKPENRIGSRSAQNLEVIVQYKVTPTEAHHRRVAALGGRLNAKRTLSKARTIRCRHLRWTISPTTRTWRT